MTAPIAREERSGLIDALRGFALFGVLAVNLGLYTGYWGMPPEHAAALPSAGADKIARILVGALLMGKFITLFSFLFGVGFAVYLQRSDTRRWMRRLAIMLAIGLVHGFLIWAGDILTTYALLGFVLLAFRRRDDRTIVRWAVVFLATCMLGAVLRNVFGAPRPGQAAWIVVHAPTWFDALVANTGLWASFWITPAMFAFLGTVLGRLLLGYVVGRRRLLQDAPQHLPFFRKLLRMSVVVAVPSAGVLTVMQAVVGRRLRGSPWAIPLSGLEEIATLSTAAVYLAGFVLLYQRPGFRRLVTRLEHVGRMALTNYLTHSVVCTLVFYTWPGLGLAGGVGPAAALLFAVGLYGVQMIVSTAWLQRFRFGPVEWLWRSLTYGTRQPMSLR